MSDSITAQRSQILQCFKQMDDLYHAYAVEQHLSDSAFWILYALCEAEKPYTQNDLCEEWYYTKQTVHSTIAGLAKAGYIRLEHLPGSRNKKTILLTQAGQIYVDRHIRPLIDAEETAFGQLSEEERAGYFRLLRKHIALFSEAVNTMKKA